MPLKDDYKSERELKEWTRNISEAITESLHAAGIVKYDFMLFLVDRSTGQMEFVTDIQVKEEYLMALKAFIARESN